MEKTDLFFDQAYDECKKLSLPGCPAKLLDVYNVLELIRYESQGDAKTNYFLDALYK